MKIVNLRVNHIENPLGYCDELLTFTWTVEEAISKYQKEAKIEISKDPFFHTLLWESEGEISQTGTTIDFTTEPATRYYYRITVVGETMERATSEVAWFESGLKEKGFDAKWIEPSENKEIHPILFQTFELKEEIKSARAYVCGLGLYELSINDHKSGEEYLLPGYYDYNQWMQYQTFDITDSLCVGKNTVSVCLGDGWYKGRFGYMDGLKEFYGNTRKLICQLVIEQMDGSTATILSDESWKWVDSSILSSSIYDGETIDARKSVNYKEALPVQVCDVQDVKLQERLSPAITITERKKPEKLILTPSGEKVLDFGQIMTGWVEFKCQETSGSEIILQFGEVLQQDCFYNENLRSALQEFHLIANGERISVRPHFTFYGFRYVKVSGIEEISLSDFEACVIHSDLKRIGTITTSNSKVNQLIENVVWGQRGNFLDVPTDCPQRDERLGWTGDAQVFAKTASFNMYTPAFFHKYLYDMLLEQKELEGSVPHVVPDILNLTMKRKGEPETFHGSCAWGDVAVVIPWELYCYYGDKELLKTHYENMTLWVDYIKSQDEQHCDGRHLWTCGFHYADWLALDNPDTDTPYGKTDPYYVASAYYYFSALLTAKAAKVLDLTEDYCKYTTLASEVKEAFLSEYFKVGELSQKTQTAHVLSLYMGLYPEGKRGEVVSALRRLLEENQMHLSTGFVGTPYLCPVLTEAGLSKDAYTLLLNEEFPGWLYEVNLGATTVWERWNSILLDGSISDTGMNSLNHYAYGSIAEWMYRYMCGLNPCEEEPGFLKAIIKPYTDERFTFVKLSYESAAGLYQIHWTREETKVIYDITVPFNATAEFIPESMIEIKEINGEKVLPSSSITLDHGNYKIIGTIMR